MEFDRGFGVKNQKMPGHFHGGSRNGFESNTLLVIKLPDLRVMHIASRSVLLVIIIFALPFIMFQSRDPTSSYADAFGSDPIDVNFLNMVLQGLANEGLIKNGDKALILSSGVEVSRFSIDNAIDLVFDSDFGLKSSLPDVKFDFVFTSGLVDTQFVDRVLKVGGIVSMQLSNELSNDFEKQSNYKIVYLRRHGCCITAMRKTRTVNEVMSSSAKRLLCQLPLEAKKAALNGLEDVLLEPPRKALEKTTGFLKMFKYLPDLLDDSLEGYSRRIFINVGLPKEKDSVKKWFSKNYPTRNQEFEMYNIEVARPGIDVSHWLQKNVNEEDFVVMKAEADVVEEMIKSSIVSVVDELFLECKNQWQDEKRKKSQRAYWECLALYGRLRDEGVAVHQWW
ncbi:hypothetical protein HS088_TW17G00904 [Tripterygium wilfordii]|uniref:DUF7870 domain-containing protein n=1 Tax=Tripterygium wilfordii TaxID=458696 RepID=A0A7J7CH56_TRIWF|nr:uncharacterized protein LOC119981712 [Tripterygium wilfordii]KAF5733361.1 hypothetical protein HS088_TW17G00904 [Tripterygium wilfordii]